MRLYLEKLPTKIHFDDLEQYKRKSIDENYLLSTEGIYKINAKNILLQKYTDSIFRNYTISDTNYVLDNSTISYETCNKIPFDHKLIKKTLNIYSLHPKSKNKLVIETITKNVTDIYFLLNEYPDNKLVTDDITTLVSLLN